MIPLAHLFDFYSRRHYEFMMGWSVVGNISAVITFETFAMVFCAKFGISGTPSLLIYAGAPVIALICVTLIGNKMIKSGYAHKYQQYGANVNKDWARMVETMDMIRKEMEDRK